MSAISGYDPLVEDFAPGFMDAIESNRLPGGAIPDGKNAWFHTVTLEPRRATVGRRPGTRLLNPAAISLGDAIDGLFEYRRITADPVLLAVCGGQLAAFDGVDAFTPIGAAVFTPGQPARAVPFRENLIIVDGTVNKRYDGLTLGDLGTDAPTSAPGLATAAGPGVTGDYEGYAVWYDPILDHESSPSATSAPVTFANQQRRWSLPAGAPGPEYTHWRVYARRVDTEELNFYRAGAATIATGTITEAVSDAARRDLGPLPNENDKPAAPFLALGVFKGHGIGLELESDEFVVSKQGDLQSWHPKNRFAVDRGSGTPLTTARNYGEEFLLQKDHATFRLVGSTVPFEIVPVHSAYGSVSHDAAGEIDHLYYAWDREKGPYVTDTVNFRTLSRGRIDRVLARVTRSALANIRFFHDEAHRLACWVVPVDGATRPRFILAYHYELDAWLPPIDGLEYGAVTTFTDPTTDAAAVYIGDQWGRVFELWRGDREGVRAAVATAALSGTMTAATADSITDAAAAFDTTGDGLAGLPIAVVSPGGTVQWRRIASNTGTVITLDTTFNPPFTTVPDVGWRYVIGGIDYFQWTPVFDAGDPFTVKRQYHLYLAARAVSVATQLLVRARFNGAAALSDPIPFTFGAGGAVWGEATSLWGSAVWGQATEQPGKRELGREAFNVQFRIGLYDPDLRFVLTALALTDDRLPRRKVSS